MCCVRPDSRRGSCDDERSSCEGGGSDPLQREAFSEEHPLEEDVDRDVDIVGNVAEHVKYFLEQHLGDVSANNDKRMTIQRERERECVRGGGGIRLGLGLGLGLGLVRRA